ncbi:hypothetical protein MKK84_24715 [Methylobacterium sp. E-065]|uniref:hypothetical protein n=1 Tax=Methylobacterium sp. E-065 TaxID=2836583 RepID=UPI001FB8CC82|nr:hypothetical protein [Methylobacterium sp. E-065]MCJ2020592.1 hypothetical protein [Methylobacterium sp. E-065]
MTISMFVEVPKDVAWVAEVTTVERKAGGEIRAAWTDTIKAGEVRWFYPHDGQSIVVAEGTAGIAGDGHVGLVGVFAFGLNQTVSLVGSDERGTVIGRAEYAENGRSYLVRYRAGDGRLTEAWWNEPALAAIASPPTPDMASVAAEEPLAPAEQPDPADLAGAEAQPSHA